MKFITVILSVILSIFYLGRLAWAQAPSEWVQVENTKDGITVYEKKTPGQDVVAFRGEGTIEAPLDRVASVITDCARAPEWIEDLKESRVIRAIGPLESIVYDHVGTPFIMKDREFVAHAISIADPAHHSLLLEYKSVEDANAPKTNYIRGEMLHANYILTSQGTGKDQKTLVVGDILVDPKGSVPKWIVNAFQRDWPVNTFRRLRKQVQKTDIKIDPKFSNLNL